MTASGNSPPGSAPTSVERRARRLPWGIEVQTWRLVETRTLPTESARLPLSLLFEEEADRGAVPCTQNDQADTLESPAEEVAGESLAPDHACDKAEGS
jgi:hypothetical protein